MTNLPELLALLVAGSLLVLVSWLAQRARVLFEVDIRDHRVMRARGRIPPRLLSDFLDVSPRTSGSRLYIRCFIERQQPRILARGDITEESSQQLRNLLGLWPLSRLKSAPRIHVA